MYFICKVYDLLWIIAGFLGNMYFIQISKVIKFLIILFPLQLLKGRFIQFTSFSPNNLHKCSTGHECRSLRVSSPTPKVLLVHGVLLRRYYQSFLTPIGDINCSFHRTLNIGCTGIIAAVTQIQFWPSVLTNWILCVRPVMGGCFAFIPRPKDVAWELH